MRPLDDGYGMAEKVGDEHSASPPRGRELALGLVSLSVFMTGTRFGMAGAFRALERDIGLSPFQLSILMVAQAFAFGIASIVLGGLADHGVPYRWLASSGCAISGACYLLFAFCSSFVPMLGLTMVSAAGMGWVVAAIPLLPPIVGLDRVGTWMGLMPMSELIGTMLAVGMFTVVSTQAIFGIEGWRVLFAIQGLSFILSGAAIGWALRVQVPPWRLAELSILSGMTSFVRFCRIPSVGICVVASLMWNFPLANTMSFLPLFLQYTGMDNAMVGLLVGAMILARAAGSMPAGFGGDCIAGWSPHHGRQCLAEASLVVWGVLLVGALWQPQSWLTYSAVVCHGFFQQCLCNGVTLPVVQGLVDPRCLSSFLGWVNLLCTSGFCGPSICALLAENVFGYQVRTPARIAAGQGRNVEEMPMDRQVANATALSTALLWCSLIPLLVCFLLMVLLHKTYPVDLASRGRTVSKSHESQRCQA